MVSFLLVVVMLLLPGVAPKAHAAGVVCLNDPSSFSTSTPCPAAGTSLNGPAPTAALTNPLPAGSVHGPTQIRVGVYLSGPDQTNGFDITILTNRTVLTPTDVDLTGTILAAPTSIVIECIDGNLVRGPQCLTTDTPGTIHFAVSGGPGILSTASTGLLFTAIYNITGKSPASGISIVFQTGCGSADSPTSDPPICVTITNGTSAPVSESVGPIGFNNNVDPNWVAISTTTPTITFNLAAPSPVAIINATAENGYPGLVGTDSISFTTIASPSLTVSFTGAVTTCVTAGLTCGVSASFSAASTGTYPITFLGNYVYSNDTTLSPGGTLAGTVNLVVIVQDFKVSVSPTSLTFIAGQNMNATVTLTSVNGFNGAITLSTSAPAGVTAIFSPSVIQMTTSPQTSKVTFNSSKGGIYAVTIRATNSSTVRNSNIVTVHVQDFTLSASTISIVGLNPGAQATSTITVAPIQGFSGTVALSINPSTGLTASLDKTSLPGGSGTSTLTVSAPGAGNYTVEVTGTFGSLAHSVTVSVNVVDFDMTASPISLGPLNIGVRENSTITIIAVNGFQGSITLTVPPVTSLTASLSANTVINSGSVILTVSGSQGGNFTLVVTATTGSLTHSVQLNVRIADFGLSAASTSPTVLLGHSTDDLITIQSQNGFAANVTLTASSSSPGPILSFSPFTSVFVQSAGSNSTTLTITVPANATPGTYLISVNGTIGTRTKTLLVTLTVPTPDFQISSSQSVLIINQGNSGSVTISVSPLNGFSGNVTLSVSSPSGLTAFLTPTSVLSSGNSVLNLTISLTVSEGNYIVTVTGMSGPLTRPTSVTVRVAGFTPIASPGALGIVIHSSDSSVITVTSDNGFDGTVTFVYGSHPAGPGLSLTISSMHVSPGLAGTTTLTVTVGNDMLPGSYVVDVNATSGKIEKGLQIILTVPVPDFSVFGTPNSVLTVAGTTGTTTISISFYNGFNGTVTLTASPASGFICTLSTTSIPAGSTTTSTLSCSGSTAGFYNVTVTGSGHWIANSSDIPRKTTVQFDNQDFTISLAATSIVANANSPAHVKITIEAVGTSGWSGTITLTMTASSGLGAVLSPATLTGTGTVNLDVTASTGGSYTVTVTGTSGSLSHTSQMLTVSVTQSTPPATILGLDPPIFYTLVGVLLALVAGGAFYARSRRRKNK